MASALPNDYARIALAWSNGQAPADVTLFFGSIDGDKVKAGHDVVVEGHVVRHATGMNQPYSIVLPAAAVAGITLKAMGASGGGQSPALEDADEAIYEVFQDGQRMPIKVRLETTADPLKANSYVHSGSVLYEHTGKVISFQALNDPIPVVVIAGIAVLLICGANIVNEIVNSCADRAARACAPNGVQSCEVKITAWSLLSGCRGDCKFTCWPPQPVAPKPPTVAPSPMPIPPAPTKVAPLTTPLIPAPVSR